MDYWPQIMDNGQWKTDKLDTPGKAWPPHLRVYISHGNWGVAAGRYAVSVLHVKRLCP